MNDQPTDCHVVVIHDYDACYLLSHACTETALIFMAVASEDPANWNDLLAYWPRYRTLDVSEFVDGMPLVVTNRSGASQAIRQTDSWIWIDLVEKRLLTGPAFLLVGRDAAFLVDNDDEDSQRCPLGIHLAPWWELLEQVDAATIDRDREVPVKRPEVNREVLFGEPMISDIADRVLQIVRSDRWPSDLVIDVGAGELPQELSTRLYALTVEVHRDWLMTPRQDLNGRMPRQCLHGGQEWIERIVSAQRRRFEYCGQMIAAPENVLGYATAPMGLPEMVIYFDLCREVISAAWLWCCSEEVRWRLAANDDCRQDLISFLAETQDMWLAMPFEGGSPPSFIIECSRRRIPRAAGVAIDGMLEQQSEEHFGDCNCPICNMMADGMLGIEFAEVDGHQLELDDEFAFSTHQTREAWDEQQRAFAEFSSQVNHDLSALNQFGESEPDEFASAWKGIMSDEPIPGDISGNMKLAFMLAEIVSELEILPATPQTIRQVNVDFIEFCKSHKDQRHAAAKTLGETLDSLADQFPVLVSRVADLRSRLDEQLRLSAGSD
ncbi:MAG: hypothetical protein R3C28_09060 [Pirellulaceae bacterium]